MNYEARTSIWDCFRHCRDHLRSMWWSIEQDDAKLKPWRLSQVLVRHGGDGVLTVFPAAATELKPGDILELMPRLSWHEDLFGNCSESPPPPPPTGQWVWPSLPAGLPTWPCWWVRCRCLAPRRPESRLLPDLLNHRVPVVELLGRHQLPEGLRAGLMR